MCCVVHLFNCKIYPVLHHFQQLVNWLNCILLELCWHEYCMCYCSLCGQKTTTAQLICPMFDVNWVINLLSAFWFRLQFVAKVVFEYWTRFVGRRTLRPHLWIVSRCCSAQVTSALQLDEYALFAKPSTSLQRQIHSYFFWPVGWLL